MTPKNKTFKDEKRDLKERILFHKNKVKKIESEWPDYFNTPRDIYESYCYSMDEIKYLGALLKGISGRDIKNEP